METRASATFDEGYEDLPSDYLELREIRINSNPAQPLYYLVPERLSDLFESGNSSPHYYTIIDTQIRLDGIPSSQVEIAYYVRIPALSDLAPTNWMLTNHPDVYLYGSMMQGAIYLRKPAAEISGWKALYDEKVRLVDEADKKARWSGGAALTIKTA
jgi:hypothetical protein